MTLKDLQQKRDNNRRKRFLAQQSAQRQAIQQQQNQLMNAVWCPGVTNWTEMIAQQEKGATPVAPKIADTQGELKQSNPVVRIEDLDSELIKKILSESVIN